MALTFDTLSTSLTHLVEFGNVGHVTLLICISFHSHSPLSFHMSFGFEWPNCVREKQVLTLKSE